MEVPTLQQFEAVVQRLEKAEQTLELLYTAISDYVYVPHPRAQQMLTVAKLDTLHEMKKRKEIKMRAVSERKYEVSLLSIAALLTKRGYTLQNVGERIAA
jgi:hypothetical protein